MIPMALQDLPTSPEAGESRWPPLLRALRDAARPDRARVAAYVRFAQGLGGWGEYRSSWPTTGRGWRG